MSQTLPHFTIGESIVSPAIRDDLLYDVYGISEVAKIPYPSERSHESLNA